MTSATSVLRKEHDAILKMLEIADAVAGRIEGGNAPPPETLRNILDFFRLFADQCHHGKEEDLLFPLLEKKGMPRNGGPLGVMLHEHDQGRGLIREMSAAADAFGKGDREGARRWAQAARGYVGLLRDHIAKENNVLFVMAENFLTEAEQSALSKDFDRVEAEKMGAGTHERLHAVMEKLASAFLG